MFWAMIRTISDRWTKNDWTVCLLGKIRILTMLMYSFLSPTGTAFPVGSISAQVCELAQARHGKGLGHFGLFDAQDKAVADTLIDTAAAWLKDKGMTRMQGPWCLSANQQCGMVIDGFDTPPFIMMPHDKPDYQGWMEQAGFDKAKDLYAFHYDLSNVPIVPRMKRVYEAAMKNKKLHMRRIDMKNFDQELRTVLDIFNDAWSDNWGFVPMTEAEIDHTAKALRPLIKDYRTRIVEYDGEPAGFMVTIPDVNDYIRDLKGKLMPFGIFKLVWRLMISKTERRVRVPLMGVRKKYQNKPIGAMMPVAMIEHMRPDVLEHGSEYSEMSWILEDNEGMCKILETMGGEIYKTMRIWEKPL